MSAVFSRFGLIAVLVLLCVVCAFSNPSFGTWSNFVNIWQNASIAGIMFIGLTWVIASGEMDVSFMEIAAVSSVVFAVLLQDRWHTGSAAALAIAGGVGFGLMNGLLVGALRFPALIVTIATSGLAHAFAFILGTGQPIYINDSGFLGTFVSASLANLPLLGLFCVALYVIAWLLQDRLVIGHHVYALAQNRKAMEEAGIACRRIVFGLFVLSGLTASLAGVLLAASLKSGQPTIGASFFLDGLTVVLLGTTVIKLGKPNIIGTAIGVVLLAVLLNALALFGWPNYVREIIKGVLLLLGASIALIARRGLAK